MKGGEEGDRVDWRVISDIEQRNSQFGRRASGELKEAGSHGGSNVLSSRAMGCRRFEVRLDDP